MIHNEEEQPPLKLTVEKGVSELVYRTGPAAKLIEPEIIKISGDIKAVGNFLSKRKGSESGLQSILPAKSIVEVDKENLTIKLLVDPENVYGATVTGQLTKSKELQIFNINTGTIITREKFITLLKFNRIYFSDYSQNTQLLAALQKIKSEVQYHNKDESDDRANKNTEFVRSVQSNVPEFFDLTMPIYNGFSDESFRVDICLGVKNGVLDFWFESTQLAELVKTKLDIIFNEELVHAEGLVIINK